MGYDIKDFKIPTDLTKNVENYAETGDYFYLGKVSNFEIMFLHDQIKIRGDISLEKLYRKAIFTRGLNIVTFHIFDSGLPYDTETYSPLWKLLHEKHDFFHKSEYKPEYREVLMQKCCEEQTVLTDIMMDEIFDPIDQRLVNIYQTLEAIRYSK